MIFQTQNQWRVRAQSFSLTAACAIFILLCLLMPPRLRSELPQADSSAVGMGNCLMVDFHGEELSLRNRCTESVQSTWFFGSGHQGFALLAANENAPTGVQVSQVARLGSLRFYACPASQPVFLTSNGGFMTAPNTSFHCGGVPPNYWKGSKPRGFTYPVLTSGDCVLENGSLIFNTNGQGSWSTRIHTNHTTNRDIWHLHFDVIDAQGRPLFTVAVGDSPAMYGSPSPVIPWAVPFSFDATRFPAISRVSVRSSC